MLIDKLQKEHPQHWANSTAIRVLTLDAVAAANSGHSGMPMGMADVATVLFFNHLKFDPKAPNWSDRDRLILSAGHGSMLLYSLLYLTGYDDFALDEIKKFISEKGEQKINLDLKPSNSKDHELMNKVHRNKQPKDGRLIENKMYAERYSDPNMYQIAENLILLAKEQNCSPISLAIAWVASHPAITAPIIGGRNAEQLEPSLKSLDIDMTEELRNLISKLSPEPPLATDRNEENTEFNYGQR